jgi:diacylglycerol kinase family enzyme|tara:strand:- start:6117 stop:6341 length:225 start_codon:yes stop_codon:yes gene_type:complete
LNDGKFEVVILRAPKITADTVASEDPKSAYEVISAKSANIQFKKPQLLQLDGELIDSYKELQIEIIPQAINVIT